MRVYTGRQQGMYFHFFIADMLYPIGDYVIGGYDNDFSWR
jgi:hypothetical protein